MRQHTEGLHDIPIFPLPNVVLFPRTVLPLHIFEPRYRQMVAHCLEKRVPIGIVLLKSGQKAEGTREEIYDIGSAGEISRHQELEDGRFHILLSGRYRFRVQNLLPQEFLFRQARVESIPEMVPATPESDGLHASLLASFEELTQGQEAEDESEEESRKALSKLDFEALVNTLCSALRFDPLTRQRLLELDDLRGRAHSILDFMGEQISLRRLADRYRGLKPEDPSLN